MNLPERVKDFLKYLATDLTLKEIAAKMNLSPRTIDGYRDNLFEKVKSILDNHSTNIEKIIEYEVSDNLTIAIIPSDERFDYPYVFGSSSDFDRAGFVLSDIINSLNIIVPEKQRIVEPHLHEFKKWWLILVDYIGYDLGQIEMENLRKGFRLTHPFERIYLISPIDEKRGSFL